MLTFQRFFPSVIIQSMLQAELLPLLTKVSKSEGKGKVVSGA
jgi:hypothetical protein